MNKYNLLLLVAAAIWGFSLVSQQAGMKVMGPWSFHAIRCTLGGLCLLLLVLHKEKKKIRKDNGYDWKADAKSTIVPAFCCSVFLQITIMMQQYGLLYTGVGKGAFITAFYIFLTPLIGLFLKKRVSHRIWLAVLIAMIGVLMITMSGSLGDENEGINKGDMLMLVAAFAYAFYLHTVDKFAEKDIVKLSCFQFLIIGLSSFIPALILEAGDITWENCVITMIPILYAGIISAAGGFTLQMVGQTGTNPNTASIILSSETVFSLFAGWISFHEILRPLEYMGCAIMVVAIALAVMPEKWSNQEEKELKNYKL